MDTPREPIVIIATRHDAPLPDPLGPPAQSTQAVGEGPGRETFLLPTLDQRLDVLRLQALRWWAERVGKRGVVASSNDHYGLTRRVFVCFVFLCWFFSVVVFCCFL